jgi:hypothetical protein
MRFQKRWVIGWMVLLGGMLAACGAAPTPRRVASYPKLPSGGNSSLAVADGPIVIETVFLAFEVNDPDEAAEKAAHLAYEYGGYENNRYGWYTDGGRAVSQEIFTPLDQADILRDRLLQMGRKNQESVARNPDGGYGYGSAWAQFSIEYLPLRPAIEWNNPPAGEFLRAICGFADEAATALGQVAFSFLLVALVLTPCGLMVVGAITLIRWLFRK